MGGCRCTYSNCTSRTEAKLHFFHYPVFDRARCLQWLKNARRFEFLKLAVSQLKNRVICQHHFLDSMFMNNKKNKLQHMAVPTENGPHCKTNENEEEDEFFAFLNDLSLENSDDFQDNLASTKRTYMSLKYLDFLTNGETVDLDTENLMDSSHANIIISKEEEPIIVEDKKLIKINKNKKTSLLAPEPVVLQNNVINVDLDMEKSIKAIEYTPLKDSFEQKCNKQEIIDDINEALKRQKAIFIEVPSLDDATQYDVLQQSQSEKDPKYKIDIISEESVSIPLPVDRAKMINVTPSFVLHMPENKARQKIIFENDCFKQCSAIIEENLPKVTEDSEQKSQLITLDNTLEDIMQPTPVSDNAKVMQIEQSCDKIDANNCSTNRQSSRIRSRKQNLKQNTSETNLCKNKIIINPERVAVIEEKRRFNMKLRDIIEAGIDKLEENENQKKKPQERIDQVKKRGSRLEQYNMLGLEHRIKRLEDNLLHRIDHNTQKILELKKLLLSNSNANLGKPRKTRSIAIQSIWSEDEHKNNLFNEISPYINTELKSILFEELFLNEHIKTYEPDVHIIKRRTKRRKFK